MTYEERIRWFNDTDDEFCSGDIRDAEAPGWLREHAPKLECPEEVLNEIFTFRTWTYRKHIRTTPEGAVITEFLPDVSWAGPYNTINCAAGFHIREGRWFRGTEDIFRSYLRFWLRGSGQSHSYTTWLPHAALDWCRVSGDYAFGISLLDDFVRDYEQWEKDWLHPCGLFFSVDDRDGMEDSISGSGLRPTRNGAMYGSACAIAEFGRMAGRTDIEERFTKKAEALKAAMELMWDKDFYRVIPEEYVPLADAGKFDFSLVSPDKYVREELGYVPWMFSAAGTEKSVAFRQLLTEEGFKAPYGITTAERRHPRFMFEFDHECLWNGPVWPFATSQTLTGAANLLRSGSQSDFTKEDYYSLLLQYAKSQYLGDIPWIDEDMDPFTGDWTARTILKSQGFPKRCGGYERGRSYNHSMFCDLVLTGLLGIDPSGDTLRVEPLIPDGWTWFRASDIPFRGDSYVITYDKDGSHFGGEAGITVTKA